MTTCTMRSSYTWSYYQLSQPNFPWRRLSVNLRWSNHFSVEKTVTKPPMILYSNLNRLHEPRQRIISRLATCHRGGFLCSAEPLWVYDQLKSRERDVWQNIWQGWHIASGSNFCCLPAWPPLSSTMHDRPLTMPWCIGLDLPPLTWQVCENE